MKKLILFTALLILSAIPVLAQTPPPPPPAAPDYFPEIWKEYSFSNDNIRFKFPVEPKVVDKTSAGDTKTTARSYERDSFISFRLMVVEATSGADLEARSKETGQIQKMRDNWLERLKDREPKVVKESNVTIDGHAGTFFQYETNDGLVTRIKIFIIKNRIYHAWVTIKKGEKHGSNWENDFEIPAMAFLDSIHLIAN